MKEWLLSVTAIILLTTVLSFVLPEGKTANVIKSMFSIVSLLVIINPLFKLDKLTTLDEFVFGQNEIVLEQNYLDFVLEKKIETLENNSIKIIEKYYSNQVFVDIQFIKDNHLDYTIEKVEVVFLDSTDHIEDQSKAKIQEELSSYLDIEVSKIIINESS